MRSGEVQQKAAARLEAQSMAVDGMRERALQDTQRAFQAIRNTIDKKEEEFCNRIVAVSDEKKHSIEARAQSGSSEGESLAAAQTALSFLLANGSSHEVVACRRLAHVRQSAATSQCRGGAGAAPVSPVVRFLPQQEEALLTAIREFGHIQEGASPLHCTVDPKPEALHPSPPVVLTVTAATSPAAVEGRALRPSSAPGDLSQGRPSNPKWRTEGMVSARWCSVWCTVGSVSCQFW